MVLVNFACWEVFLRQLAGLKMRHMISAHLLLLAIHSKFESTGSHVRLPLEGHRVWTLVRVSKVVVVFGGRALVPSILYGRVVSVISILFV